MHHGPRLAMNGHPGRDTDLILRPSESTFDFLSVVIGFRSLNNVKMKVLDENTGFVRIFIFFFFLNVYFDPGIILGHFRHPKSIFRNRNIEMLFCPVDHSKPF